MSQQNLSSFIWSVADLLRGDYKQSEYGRVTITPSPASSWQSAGQNAVQSISVNDRRESAGRVPC